MKDLKQMSVDSMDYRYHAEGLTAAPLNLIKSILVKHEAIILAEIHALALENKRLRNTLTNIANEHEAQRKAATDGQLAKYHEERRNYAMFHRDYIMQSDAAAEGKP